MRQPPVKIQMVGSVKPPSDLDGAARKLLGDKYEDFVKKHPNFTPKQLIQYSEQN